MAGAKLVEMCATPKASAVFMEQLFMKSKATIYHPRIEHLGRSSFCKTRSFATSGTKSANTNSSEFEYRRKSALPFDPKESNGVAGAKSTSVNDLLLKFC